MCTRCNVDRIGLTVILDWVDSSYFVPVTELSVKHYLRGHLYEARSYKVLDWKVARSDLVEVGNSARRKLAVCRFTSYLESSHLLVTPASWPTYCDRHITNVTLCSDVCTHGRVHACTGHDCIVYMHMCILHVYTHTTHILCSISSYKIKFPFPISDLNSKLFLNLFLNQLKYIECLSNSVIKSLLH